MSDGSPPFKMPPTTNTDPNDAKTLLEAAGLTVLMANEGSLNIPKGIVTRTEPPAGAEVQISDTVKLYVSLGITAEAPNLTGMTLDLATSTLQSRSLTIGARH